MFLSSKTTKINFCNTKCRYSPNKLFPLSMESNIRKIEPNDITLAIKTAKRVPVNKPREAKVMWDIVYELWCHYQKQENKYMYDDSIVDPIEVFCEDIDNASEGECKIYDV